MKFSITALGVFLAITATVADAQEQPELKSPVLKLNAPKEWGGEQIKLPTSFAPKIRWKGTEAIRFAPGMFKPDSDSFFSYAFVFAIDEGPELTAMEIEREMLTYYRGLSSAVLKSQGKKVDTEKFSFTLKKRKPSKKKSPYGHKTVRFVGQLKWVEPFKTAKEQTLNMEMAAWSCDQTKRKYLLVSVSPKKKDADIWKQLRKIGAGFRCHMDSK